ncbi:MAG: ParA family protein [Betaproteobacteria bacterium]|jgi:chromosome partitioning protein|nr:ParA family protein [Betaproteobacteria bacterium]
MRTILVINSKGGCGKTTVATNIASYYAAANARVAIQDYDPQGSSLQWLKLRPQHLTRIHGANGTPQKAHLLRTLQTWVPAETDIQLIDAPGGVKGLLLQDVVAKADMVVIPVGPSSIDVHATADFLKNLLLLGRVRARNIKIAVLANRVRSSMPVYEPLERFLRSLSLPFLTRISDSDTYIRAAEQGMGVFDMDAFATTAEREEFLPVVRWLDSHMAPRAIMTDRRVVDLSEARKQAAF